MRKTSSSNGEKRPVGEGRGGTGGRATAATRPPASAGADQRPANGGKQADGEQPGRAVGQATAGTRPSARPGADQRPGNGGKKADGAQPQREAGPPGGFRGVAPPGQHGAGQNEKWPLANDQRPPTRVGEEGFEPSRPFGHTDLNRARLPFRHPPGRGKKVSTTPSALRPRIRSEASCEGRCHGGSSAAL